MRLSILMFILLSAIASALPAFPGAEGFGSNTQGGRGGTIYIVSNLNDSDPGSFREAVHVGTRNYANESQYQYETWEAYIARLEAAGRRIVVFNVSGIIDLNSTLTINIPHLTIAGQTSPGGILITGRQTTINAHDVIMQHMRFRVGIHKIVYDTYPNGSIRYYSLPQYSFQSPGECSGDVVTDDTRYPCAVEPGADPEQLDSFDIWGQYWGTNPAYNIIVDHCSFGWGVDETFTISGGVVNATVQWSLVAEGLRYAGHPKGEHSKGLLVSGKELYNSNVTLHHNYIAHNNDRSPLIYGADNDNLTLVNVVNNVMYDWNGGLSPYSQGKPKVNWIHNYMKQGYDSNSYSFEVAHAEDYEVAPLIYVYGNIGSTRLSQSDPQWNVGVDWHNELQNEVYRSLTPWDTPEVTTTNMSYDYALEILETVGATKPFRDDVDQRVIDDFAAGTGRIINTINYPEDYPTYNESVLPPADTDRDGMADSWEIAKGLTVGTDDSSGDDDSDGYTNIEEYLHYLVSDVVYNDADIDEDNNIDTSEMRSYIQSWKVGLVEVNDLFSTIAIWKSGGSY